MFGNRQCVLLVLAVLVAPVPALGQSLEEGIRLRFEGQYERSFQVFETLAGQGIAEAQLELGNHYWRGWGVERNDAEAFRWYSLAADQGNAAARFELAYAYWDGLGVAQDQEEGLRRFRLLAEQGHLAAQVTLGDFHRDGNGVAADPEEAIRWYSLAAAQGDDWARRELAKLTGGFDTSGPICADLYNTVATAQAIAAGMVAMTKQADAVAARYVNSTFEEYAVDGQEQAWREQGPFWTFSNARHIAFAARRDALRERAPSELAFDLQMTGISGKARFPSPLSIESGFGAGPVAIDAPLPRRADTPPYGKYIAACDEAHGFTPVFVYGTEPG